jgi:hypothetical protein
MTSASVLSTTLSTHVVISSKAANLVFQLTSPRSVSSADGTRSVAKVSASSGVCLYLKASNVPGVWVVPLDGCFEETKAAGAGFLAVGAVGAEVALDWQGELSMHLGRCINNTYLRLCRGFRGWFRLGMGLTL